MALDLENGIFTVRGRLGHSIGPIQGQVYARERAGSGYNATAKWSDIIQTKATYSLAPVSPISIATGFSLPNPQPIGPLLMESAQQRDQTVLREDIVVASLFRGTGLHAQSAFERIGIELAQGPQAEDLFTPEFDPQSVDSVPKLTEALIGTLEQRLNAIGAPIGWDFDLVPVPLQNYNATDCLHFINPNDELGEAEFTGQTVFGRKGAVLLPENVKQLAVVSNESAKL